MPATTTKTPRKTTKSKPTELPARVRGFVLPDHLDLPKPVAEANEAVRAAAIAWGEAEAEAVEAEKQATAAADFDNAAARHAVEAGESFRLTAPAKQARLGEARLRFEAAEKLLSIRAKESRIAIRNDPDYIRDRESEYNSAVEQTEAALATLTDSWAQLLEARAVFTPARRIVEEAWSGEVVQRTLTPERQAARLEKAIARRERNGARNLPSFEELIADLKYHLEQESA